MSRSLTSLVKSIATPFGTMIPNIGTTVYLSDEEFALVSPSSLGVAWTDNGQVDAAGDAVSVQAANVAAMGALTVTAVGTQTVANPAAITSAAVATANADATYGQPEADLINEIKVTANAIRTDLAAVRTQVLAAVVDITEIFAKFDAGVTDMGTLRTKVNAALSALTGTGKPMAS